MDTRFVLSAVPSLGVMPRARTWRRFLRQALASESHCSPLRLRSRPKSWVLIGVYPVAFLRTPRAPVVRAALSNRYAQFLFWLAEVVVMTTSPSGSFSSVTRVAQ